MSQTRSEVGAEIRRARTARGLTQAALAEAAGLKSHTVTFAENGYAVGLPILNHIRSCLELPPLTSKPVNDGAQRSSPGSAEPKGEQNRSSWVLPTIQEGLPYWEFPDKRKVDPNVDPVQGEFFTPEGLVDALVRESIQNSLDAQDRDNQVRVHFSLFGHGQELRPEVHHRYLAGLWPHLMALPDVTIPGPDEPMGYLVIEDFGTVGLTGDTAQYSDSASDGKNNFYYFWRNVGRSSKSESDRGRWGLGKTVFAASSRINSFFGLTIRAGEHVPHLMGQSVLKIHSIGGEDFTPYGGFGRFDQERFVLPIDDREYAKTFCDDFKLERRDESGLSIVVPFFRGDEIELRDLIGAAVRHYFFPILTESLVLSFTDGASTELVTSESIDQIVDRYVDQRARGEGPAQLKKIFDLARWAKAEPEAFQLPEPDSKAPQWERITLPAEQLIGLRARFDRGERIRLQAILRLRSAATLDETPVAFDLYLERDPEAERWERHFIRRGITIPNKDSMRTSGARGLVVIDDPTLSTLLGDAENPAHTEWNEKSPRAKEKYRYSVGTIKFIKQAFDQAVGLLSLPPEGMEEEILSDVFSVEIVDDTGKIRTRQRKPEKGQSPSAPPLVPALPRTSLLIVRQTSSGFSVHGAPNADCTGKRLIIKAAFDVGSGNPFTRYERFDFELNKPPIAMQLSGVSPGGIEGNEAEFLIEAGEFAVVISGFDANRDLRVKADLSDGGSS